MYFGVEGDSNWDQGYDRNQRELNLTVFLGLRGKRFFGRTGVYTFVTNLVALELVFVLPRRSSFHLVPYDCLVCLFSVACQYSRVVENRRV